MRSWPVLGKKPCLRPVYREVPQAALVGLAYHHPCPCLPRLLEKAEAPPFLLKLYATAKKVVELVSQLRNAAVVYTEQLLLLELR